MKKTHKLYGIAVSAFLALLAAGCASDGETELCQAIRGGYITYAQYLIDERGTDVNKQGGGFFPLLVALDKKNYQLADYLIQKGAIVDLRRYPKDPESETALMIFSHYQEKEKIEYLLRHGADPNLCDKRGYNSLMIAAASNWNPFSLKAIRDFPQIVQLFIDNDVNLYAVGKDGKTAYELLVARENEDALAIFEKYILSNEDDSAGSVKEETNSVELPDKTSEDVND